MLKVHFNFRHFLTLLAIVSFLVVFSPVFTRVSYAANGVPRTINFQGRLVTNPGGVNVANGTVSIVFSLYNNASGGTAATALWSETQGSVTVTDGIFRVVLGSVTPIPANFNFNWDGLYLGVNVAGNGEMTPRIQMASVPFAFNAQQVAGLTVQDTSGNASTSGTLQVANGATVKLPGSGTALIYADTGTTGNLTSLTDSTTQTGSVVGLNLTLSGATSNYNQYGLQFNLSGSTSGNQYDILGSGSSWYVTSAGALHVASCVGCGGAPGGGGPSFWQELIGALSPVNLGDDLLLGGSSTASALFSFTGVKTGQTIASASGNLILMPNNGWGGQLGIGTTNLQNNALNVMGNVYLDTSALGNSNLFSIYDNSAHTGGTMFSVAKNNGYLSTIFGNGDMGNGTWFGVEDETGNINFVTAIGVIRLAGNVGIGTSVPKAALDILGSASLSGNLSFNTSGSELRMYDNFYNYTGFKAPNDLTGTSNYVYTLPSSYGVNGQFMSTNGSGGIIWSSGATPAVDMASCQESRSTTDTLTNSFADITLDTTDVENNTAVCQHDAVNTERINISETGLYAIHYHADVSKSTINDWSFQIVKNASTVVPGSAQSGLASSTDRLAASVTTYVTLTAGDYIRVQGKYTTNASGVVNTLVFSATRMAGPRGAQGIAGADGAIRELNGTMVPINLTEDFLFGSLSSASARFKLTANNLGAGTLGIASISGTTSFASLVVNNDGVGDLFTASASGWTRFAINNSGNINATGTLTGLTGLSLSSGAIILGGSNGTGLCLTGGTTAGWGTCGGGPAGSSGPFQELTGAILPNNSTMDFLIGGQSSDSAKFAVLGVNTGQTIASASGNLIVMPQNGWGGYVGLNTTTPSFNLDVLGTTRVGNQQAIDFGGAKAFYSNYKTTDTSQGAFATIGSLEVNPSGSTSQLYYGGFYSIESTTGNVQNITGRLVGFQGQVSHKGTGTLTEARGFAGFVTNSAAGIITSAFAGKFNVSNNSTGQIGSGYGVWVGSAANGGGGTFTNNYGVYINDQRSAGSTDSYNLYSAGGASHNYLGGNLGIGTTDFGNGQLVVNQTNFAGAGDIFAASTSGTTKFVITNGGNVSLAGTTGITLTGNAAGITFNGTGITQFTTASNQHLSLNAGGLGLVGINTDGTAPLANFDIRANVGTVAVASASGRTSYAALVVDNSSGDLFAASASGATRFVIAQNGTVTIGNSTDGLVFSPTNAGPIYSGNARPTKTITLSPEYAGAVLTASGSATTNGSMTADASPSANFRTYYEWSSTTASPMQDYTVAVRVTLPQDFSAWAPTNAMTIDYNTGGTSATANKLDVFIYNPSVSTSTPVTMHTGQVSASTHLWTTITFSSARFTGSVAWNTAGQTATIYLKMSASGTYNNVQVGDIVLNYLSKF